MHGHPWTNNKLEHYAIQFWHLHIIYSKAPFSSWKERPYMYTLHSLVPKVILYRYSPASVTQKNRNVNIRPPAAHIWHRIGLWISVHCPNFYWPERNVPRSPKCAACSPLQQNGIFVSASSTTNTFKISLSGFPLAPEVDKGDEMGRRLVDWASSEIIKMGSNVVRKRRKVLMDHF